MAAGGLCPPCQAPAQPPLKTVDNPPRVQALQESASSPPHRCSGTLALASRPSKVATKRKRRTPPASPPLPLLLNAAALSLVAAASWGGRGAHRAASRGLRQLSQWKLLRVLRLQAGIAGGMLGVAPGRG